MNTDRRTALLIGIGLVVLCAMIAQPLIIAPHQRHLKDIRLQIQEQEELLRVQQGIAKAWPLVRDYQQRLPETSSPDWLMREVAKLAEQAHVQLFSIEPDLPRPFQHGATRMSVQVQLECPYHDVGTFVSLLESSAKYIQVEELELRPAKSLTDMAGSNPHEAKTHVRMVLSTLSFPPLAVGK